VGTKKAHRPPEGWATTPLTAVYGVSSAQPARSRATRAQAGATQAGSRSAAQATRPSRAATAAVVPAADKRIGDNILREAERGDTVGRQLLGERGRMGGVNGPRKPPQPAWATQVQRGLVRHHGLAGALPSAAVKDEHGLDRRGHIRGSGGVDAAAIGAGAGPQLVPTAASDARCLCLLAGLLLLGHCRRDLTRTSAAPRSAPGSGARTRRQ